jgi:hypothetical protein
MSLDQEGEHRSRMERDYEIGCEFKDSLIPLALEYYMGVIDKDEEEVSHSEYDSEVAFTQKDTEADYNPKAKKSVASKHHHEKYPKDCKQQ